jgi:hypothetical protein
VLDDLPALDADDVDHLDLHLAAGRRDAHELAAVRVVEDLARDDLVALGDLVVDHRMEVGEGRAERLELLAHAVGPLGDAGRPAAIDDVGVQELGEALLLGGGLVLVDEAPDDPLVGLCVHGPRIACARRPAHR